MFPRPTPRRSAPGTAQLSVQVDVPLGRIVLSGDLVRATAHRAADAVLVLLAAGGPITVEVSGLQRCDADGLRAIGGTYRRVLRGGGRLTLTGVPRWLREDLTRLRLDHHVLAPATELATT